MVDSVDPRILRGHRSWTRDLLSRDRSFLHRDLNYVLDSHELAVLRSERESDANEPNMIANERRQAGWDYPTTDMLKDFVQGRYPVLNITSIQLRHPDSEQHGHERIPHEPIAGDPDWLPHPDDGYNASCQITVTVSDARTPDENIYMDVRNAVIRRSAFDNDKPVFEAKPDQPFRLPFRKLHVLEGFGKKGNRHWKLTNTAKYNLNLGIRFEDARDTAYVLSQLEGDSRESYEKAPVSEGVLRTIWSDLPECPSKGKLLSLQRTKANRVLKIPYGAEVSMGWLTHRETAISLHNRLVREDKEARQLPTPSASDDQEVQRSKCVVCYSYRYADVTRKFSQPGFACIFCVKYGGAEHSSFDRLRLHYKTMHSHLKFELIQEDKDNCSIHILEAGNAQPNSAFDINEEGYINWIAPQHPFDISKHIHGTSQSWGSFGEPGSSRPKGGARKPRQRKDIDVEDGPFRPRGRRTFVPEEVQDLPVPPRKQNSVPDIPGIRFFRTTSKQTVEPNTFIDDSDDEIEENWLDESQDVALNILEPDEIKRDLRKRFNRHVDREVVSSDFYTPDSVVRFARKEKPVLQDPRMHAAFRDMLEQYRRNFLIDEPTVAYCLEYTAPISRSIEGENCGRGEEGQSFTPRSQRIGLEEFNDGDDVHMSDVGGPVIAESPEAARAIAEGSTDNALTSSGSRKRRTRWVNGRMEFGNADSSVRHPISSCHTPPVESLAVTRQTCICGQPVTGLRGTLGCADPSCGRSFHLKCVKIERSERRMNWRCESCAR